MITKILSLFVLLLSGTLAFAQERPLGVFEKNSDIGNPKLAGSAAYDKATQSYTLKGGGYNIWFNRDEFHYLYREISGDFLLTANFAFVGETGDPHRKIGWMIRESAEPDSIHVSAVSHVDGLMVMQWRQLRGAYMRDPEDEIFLAKKGGQIIQMERRGKTVSMRVANPGEPLQMVGSHEMPHMADSVLAGLYVCSHNAEAMETATIWNVRIDKPVENRYEPNPILARTQKPFQGVLGSRLEILNVADGRRKVIHESKTRFEAPNWMPDGKRLLFNEAGSLFTISVEGGTPVKLNTGFADRNNNDHGISFDGKMLAISHHREGLPGGGSTVYVLPLAGGTPKLVTEGTPSYWHGWSPDGKEVVVVAQRGGSKVYNLFKVNVDTWKEVALTQNTSGHVDGCEYSPDGQFIYYNADASGTMQIWRMKPDGTGREQVTFDEYHDWFPHVSPDGKWIAYISFPTDIEPGSHPTYRRVMLRLMPASGGAPTVIAHLYGGQGTLNVNSWSPDSKQLAFVSNSE